MKLMLLEIVLSFRVLDIIGRPESSFTSPKSQSNNKYFTFNHVFASKSSGNLSYLIKGRCFLFSI